MKDIIRKDIVKRRKQLNNNYVIEMSHLISEKLLAHSSYLNADCIFTYLNFRNEVETNGIIEHALNSGKKVIVPVCNMSIKQIVSMEIKAMDSLVRNSLGILEPNEASVFISDRNTIDIALVPGLAFDRNGNRIGFGTGYYDRFFNTAKQDIYKIALAFSIQLVDKLEPEPHDVPVDMIITENEIIKCR